MFENGDYVIVDRDYLAEIVGIYNSSFYIVKWYDKPKNIGNWTCTVIFSDLMRKATQEEIISHLKV